MTQPIPTKLRQENAGWEANGDYARRRYIVGYVWYRYMYRTYIRRKCSRILGKVKWQISKQLIKAATEEVLLSSGIWKAREAVSRDEFQRMPEGKYEEPQLCNAFITPLYETPLLK